ncbi:MAG: TlpA disulfide reductase family protein [Bacteroidota bacterium]
MKKIITLLFIIFCSSVFIYAQNVTLKGIAKGAEGKALDVYAYSDLLSCTMTKIASGKIDTLGNFNFSFTTGETIFTYVKVGFTRAPLYVEPGKTYNLQIKCDDCKSADDKSNPYLNTKDLVLTIENTDSTELNNLIYHFNDDYDRFMYSNYVSLIKQRNKSKVDSFRIQINNKYSSISNAYFSELVRYRLASVEQLAQLADNYSIAEKYFFSQPVLYKNTGYMEFFNDFFTEYVTMESSKIKSTDLEKTINELKSMPAFLDSLGKDSILQNEIIRELVAVKCLAEIYYKKTYDQVAVLSMLQYIADSSKFPEHKTAASNYMSIFTKLTKGTIAPPFSLKDMNGEKYSLTELNKGKYVYLIFWTTWCVPCIAEMELIEKLIEKYGTKIEFVGISCDKEYMTFYHYMKQKSFGFTSLHRGGSSELIENYDVRAFPKFIMIDPDGKIHQNPAITPSENLNEYLFDLTKEKK